MATSMQTYHVKSHGEVSRKCVCARAHDNLVSVCACVCVCVCVCVMEECVYYVSFLRMCFLAARGEGYLVSCCWHKH